MLVEWTGVVYNYSDFLERIVLNGFGYLFVIHQFCHNNNFNSNHHKISAFVIYYCTIHSNMLDNRQHGKLEHLSSTHYGFNCLG